METPKSNNKIIRRRQREIQDTEENPPGERGRGRTDTARSKWTFETTRSRRAFSALSPTPSGERLALPMPWVQLLGAESLQSHPTLWDSMVYSPPGSSVHGILQERILEWVAMPSSRGSSWPRNRTHISKVSCVGRRVLYHKHHLGSLDSNFWPPKLWE